MHGISKPRVADGPGPSMGRVGLGRDFEISDGLGWVKDDGARHHPIRVY